MDYKKLTKLQSTIEELRNRRGIKPRELESLAKALGRTRHSRGSEPNWVSEVFFDLRPVSIPHHGGRDINRFTAQSILDQLELDVERHQSELDKSMGR